MKERTEKILILIPFIVLAIYVISLIVNIDNPTVIIISTITFTTFTSVFFLCVLLYELKN